MATKSSSTPKTVPAPAPRVTTDAASGIPIISMVLGVVSLVSFMWFLGIPAIILGIIGLKKYKENRGFSITGLVTGIISTLLMVLTAIFLIVLVVVGIFNADWSESDTMRPTNDPMPRSNQYNDQYYRSLQESF